MTIRRSSLAVVADALSPLAAFDALAPRDAARRVGRGIAYGPGPRQGLDVHAPAVPGEAAPVMVFFYGGGWSSGRRQDYGFVGRALASRGFVTVTPDYRLTPEVRFPAFVEDGAAAVAWARDNAAAFGGDPERLVLAGHSAGAYIAAMLALDGAFLGAAGVGGGAVKAFAGLAGPYDFLPLRSRATIAAFGGHADLPATQPIAHARGDAPAAFLAHGGRDRVVGAGNSVKFGRALLKAGATAEVKIYPRLGHAGVLLSLSRPFRGLAPVLDDMTAFLNRHADAAAQYGRRAALGNIPVNRD